MCSVCASSAGASQAWRLACSQPYALSPQCRPWRTPHEITAVDRGKAAEQ